MTTPTLNLTDLILDKVRDLPIQKDINDLQILPVELEHIWQLDKLPLNHKDPFDRMLIAQAIRENFSIVSIDNIFAQYLVKILW